MGDWNSPYLDQGDTDGARDSAALSQCPPGFALGPDGSKTWSSQYRKGYERSFNPVPCPCDGSCKRGEERGNAPDNGPHKGSEYDTGGVEIWGGGVDISASDLG